MLGRLADNRTDIPGVGHRLFNNLSFRGRRAIAEINEPQCELEGNVFSPEVPLAESDFQSLDDQELLRPRTADGALPAVRFLHPTTGSG